MHCYQSGDKAQILHDIQALKSKVDAIVVTPHWGEENQTKPNKEQINFAYQVLNAGAIAVLGTHPHVLQPGEKYITQDGRSTLISYSLGNFVSYQGAFKNRTSMILLLGLTRNDQHTVINGVRFVPLFMHNRRGWDNIQVKVISSQRFSEQYPKFFSPFFSEKLPYFLRPLSLILIVISINSAIVKASCLKNDGG